jgi:hypothetical protein
MTSAPRTITNSMACTIVIVAPAGRELGLTLAGKSFCRQSANMRTFDSAKPLKMLVEDCRTGS